MKRNKLSLLFSAFLGIVFAALSVVAQTSTFSDKNVEYTFDLPEPVWKMTVKPSATSPSVEYVYADRMEGHLEIRKVSMKPNEMLSDVIVRERDEKLQFKPGYIAGKEENFSGGYPGKVSNYEYTQSGRNMSGRFYFLKINDTTVYILKFTGLRDQLKVIRNQTDSIARTFKVK